ncbi:hypothetical protein FMEAI12_2700014 [Parafrankia sp. Ea1.12]|nr:hypothetical protein FMEAI12_2700014 [Parafrankia sp. Ea1.12]
MGFSPGFTPNAWSARARMPGQGQAPEHCLETQYRPTVLHPLVSLTLCDLVVATLVQNIRRGHYELGTNTDLHRIGGCANGSGSATEGCPWPPRGSIGRRYVPAGLEPCPGCGWVTVLWSGCTVCDPRSAVPALPTLRG